MNGAPISSQSLTSIELYHIRKKMVWYVCRFLGQPIPYKWGGDDPLAGFDCNGIVHEGLQSVGLEEHGYDCTAHQIYLNFKGEGCLVKGPDQNPMEGCLVFWFKDGKAYHVAMCINRFFVVEMSGGGSKTTTLDDAIKHNAFIKMRPIGYRGDNYKWFDPFDIVERK